MIMDGYDIQSMAYAAPLIIEEWGVQNRCWELCLVQACLVCLLDHFIKFTFWSFWSPSDTTDLDLYILHIDAVDTTCRQYWAIDRNPLCYRNFLGGIMPNVMAYSSEIVPYQSRIFTMMVISCGYTVGAMLGAEYQPY